MLYSFDDAKAAERHETQYFEMLCNRGIYHKGWTAMTRHRNPPWIVVGDRGSLSADRWELYDTTKDWSQAHGLAKQHPEKVAELQRLFELEASARRRDRLLRRRVNCSARTVPARTKRSTLELAP